MYNASNSLSLHVFFLHVPYHSLCRATGEVNNDIVVEMKTDKANEEAGLLNKRPSTEQVRNWMQTLRKLMLLSLNERMFSSLTNRVPISHENVTHDAADYWHEKTSQEHFT